MDGVTSEGGKVTLEGHSAPALHHMMLPLTAVRQKTTTWTCLDVAEVIYTRPGTSIYCF